MKSKKAPELSDTTAVTSDGEVWGDFKARAHADGFKDTDDWKKLEHKYQTIVSYLI